MSHIVPTWKNKAYSSLEEQGMALVSPVDEVELTDEQLEAISGGSKHGNDGYHSYPDHDGCKSPTLHNHGGCKSPILYNHGGCKSPILYNHGGCKSPTWKYSDHDEWYHHGR